MNRIILIIGVAVGLFILAFDVYISHDFANKFSLSIQQKNEKLEDIANFQEYLSQLKDTETGQRGYLITGNPTYLEPYKQGIRYLNSKQTQEFLEKSENLEDVSEDVEKLRSLTTDKLNELQSAIDKYNDSGFEAAKDEVSTDRGKTIMDNIRNRINNILIVKHNALEKHENENNSYNRSIIDLLATVNIIYLIFISVFLYILYLYSERWEG